MEGARPHFHVVWLQNDTALFSPVVLQGKDQALETGNIVLRHEFFAQIKKGASIAFRTGYRLNTRGFSAPFSQHPSDTVFSGHAQRLLMIQIGALA